MLEDLRVPARGLVALTVFLAGLTVVVIAPAVLLDYILQAPPFVVLLVGITVGVAGVSLSKPLSTLAQGQVERAQTGS